MKNIFSDKINNKFSNNINDRDKVLKNFLQDLDTIVPFDKADIFFYAFDKDNGCYNINSFIPVGWDDIYLQDYLNHFYKIDDVLPIISNPLPILFRSTDIFVINERAKTEYYKNFVKPAKLYFAIEGNIHIKQESQDYIIGAIGLFRDHHDFTHAELNTIKSLRPQLSQTIQNYLNTVNNDARLYPLLSILDKLQNVGICLMDQNYQLLFYNDSFTNLAEVNDNGQIKTEFLARISHLCASLRKSGNNHIRDKCDLQGELFTIEISSINLNKAENNFYFMVTIYNIKNLLFDSLLVLKEKHGLD